MMPLLVMTFMAFIGDVDQDVLGNDDDVSNGTDDDVGNVCQVTVLTLLSAV